MMKLRPTYDMVVNVTIDDVHLESPISVINDKHEDYISKLKRTLLKRSEERQKFNFYLSESRTRRFGGVHVEDFRPSDSATTNGNLPKSVNSGMAISFNWRLPRAVRFSLPRDIAMNAR